MKRQYFNGNALPLPPKPCAIYETKIQTFDDSDEDFWQLASLRWQQKWRVEYGSFVPEIGIRLFSRFPTIAYRVRARSSLPFGNAKCRRMQLRVHTVAWRTSIFQRRVCHNIYESIVGEKKKEKESFCGPNDTPMFYPFFFPTLSSPDGERTDKPYGVRGETTKERRGRDSKSKGSIKSCRCVSRAQQRGRCQKGLPYLPRDSIREAVRNGSRRGWEAISLICRVIKQILQFYPRKYINLARRSDVMQEKWVLTRKINDQISRSRGGPMEKERKRCTDFWDWMKILKT